MLIYFLSILDSLSKISTIVFFISASCMVILYVIYLNNIYDMHDADRGESRRKTGEAIACQTIKVIKLLFVIVFISMLFIIMTPTR